MWNIVSMYFLIPIQFQDLNGLWPCAEPKFSNFRFFDFYLRFLTKYSKIPISRIVIYIAFARPPADGSPKTPHRPLRSTPSPHSKFHQNWSRGSGVITKLWIRKKKNRKKKFREIEFFSRFWHPQWVSITHRKFRQNRSRGSGVIRGDTQTHTQRSLLLGYFRK